MKVIGMEDFNLLGDIIPIPILGLILGFVLLFGGIVYAYWATRLKEQSKNESL